MPDTRPNPEPAEAEGRSEVSHFWYLLLFLTAASFAYHFWLELAWP